VRHPCGRTRRAERYGSSPVRRFRISVLVVATLRRQEIRRSYRIRDCDERHERVATQDTRERAGTMLAGQCHPTRKALRPCPRNRVASAAGGAFPVSALLSCGRCGVWPSDQPYPNSGSRTKPNSAEGRSGRGRQRHVRCPNYAMSAFVGFAHQSCPSVSGPDKSEKSQSLANHSNACFGCGLHQPLRSKSHFGFAPSALTDTITCICSFKRIGAVRFVQLAELLNRGIEPWVISRTQVE
jgi:hypothetical protein